MQNRLSLLVTFRYFVPFMLISTLTRVLLFAYSLVYKYTNFEISSFAKIFACGVLNDFVAYLYFAAPISIASLLLPRKCTTTTVFKIFGYIAFFVWIFILCFNMAAETIFWQEFGTRFNFIAVDYLIYTNEVLGNIIESYQILPIIIGLSIVAIIIFLLLYKPYLDSLVTDFLYSTRIKQAIYANLLVLFVFCFYSNSLITIRNAYYNELAQNGIYNLFSAFRNNSIEYSVFYKTIKQEEALANLKKLIKDKGEEYIDNAHDIARSVTAKGQFKNYNIVILSIESLSAEFLTNFGNSHNLTPNIDKLASESLFFTKYFASGTRTVRGLEAMTLSVPPTPGSSIIRRPNNEKLYSIATVLKDYNYDLKFLYGGYGYFDNMNYFFSENHFEVIDRSNIENVLFSNIWGVCDEDLLRQTIIEADKSYQNKKPFFSMVMTTSNHRPYTYPEGKIDIASGTNRAGAVKYTDYAVGEFIKQAKSKPWFDNTIFVITADHCASSAGKTYISADKYHIPLLIYAPKIIKPKKFNSITSQIDLAPTLLGLLNASYVDRFFGSNVLLSPKNRAFLATYQQLGYLEDKRLIVLEPKKKTSIYNASKLSDLKEIEFNDTNKQQERDAISYYQIADYLFYLGRLRE